MAADIRMRTTVAEGRVEYEVVKSDATVWARAVLTTAPYEQRASTAREQEQEALRLLRLEERERTNPYAP